MRQMRFWLLSILVLLFMAENASAKVPVCDQAPSFAQARNYETFDFSRLPNQVLVAREAEVWVAHKEKGLKLFLKHNFKNMKSDVRCSKAPYQGSINLSTWVPTLIDLSTEKKWGDSLWQIQALTTTKKVGVWSQKARLAPIEEVRRIAQRGIWRPGEGDSYELIWDQTIDGAVYSIRVVYDVLR
ncbi:MAG: hypothetical protein KF681_05430 [Bdellovibrionaceae bacterium]|nr:hypothetical protein [Pseudobdellovibrionaceae bacterium]